MLAQALRPRCAILAHADTVGGFPDQMANSASGDCLGAGRALLPMQLWMCELKAPIQPGQSAGALSSQRSTYARAAIQSLRDSSKSLTFLDGSTLAPVLPTAFAC